MKLATAASLRGYCIVRKKPKATVQYSKIAILILSLERLEVRSYWPHGREDPPIHARTERLHDSAETAPSRSETRHEQRSLTI